MRGRDPFGVYLHIPFCTRRCEYCAFAIATDAEHLIGAYVDACLAEIERAQRAGHLRPSATVFFGGGTPSLLPGSEIARLLGALERPPGAEVTVECNPEDVSEALLDALCTAGVTRISLGVQSLVPHVLASLGRHGDPAEALRAARLVGSAGFASWSVDLIYGAAGESDDDWRASLDGICSLEQPPGHLSAYALTVEAGTVLQRDARRHPDDDVQAGRYELADDLLGRAGLSWYEVSNWSRPGETCRHNANYWRQGDYLGIGCAAHSHLDGYRFFNVANAQRYIAAIAAGASTMAGAEHVVGRARRLEALELALRTSDGVPASALVEGTLPAGLVERDGERAVLTRTGRLLADEVSLHLDPDASGRAAGIGIA